jgi:hypothetical protein
VDYRRFYAWEALLRTAGPVRVCGVGGGGA